MSRPRRPRAARAADLTPTEWCFLLGARDHPAVNSAEWWSLQYGDQLFRPGRPTVAELWKTYSGDVLRAWLIKRPGTRPDIWWQYSAPERERRRLGGVGTPLSEGDQIKLRHGIPAAWLLAELADLWRRTEGSCPWPAVDPHDPPIYEAQAMYLDRHRLLTGDERRRLPAAAFDPEPVGKIFMDQVDEI